MRITAMASALILACLTMTVQAQEESTRISAKAFIDFTHIDAKLDGEKTDASGYGVDVTRFYVVIDHTFDKVWSANVTTDFQYLNAITSVNSSGNPVTNVNSTANPSAEVFIKKAYVQATLNDALSIRVGSADMPWNGFVENLYGYRYFERVVTDRLGVAASADWGVHASGTFGDGLVSYAGSVVNGRGFKDTRRSKSMDVEGRLSVVPLEGFTLGIGYRTGKLGQETESNPAEKTAKRVDALIAYVHGRFRVGAEYFSAKNYSNALVQQGNPAPLNVVSDKAEGESLWASFNVTPRISTFARYDEVDTSKRLNPDAKNRFAALGIAVTARKNVDIAFAFKRTKIDNTATSSTKINEIGLWSQVAF